MSGCDDHMSLEIGYIVKIKLEQINERLGKNDTLSCVICHMFGHFKREIKWSTSVEIEK